MIKQYFDQLVSNNDEFNAFLHSTLEKDKLLISRRVFLLTASLLFIFGLADIISATSNLTYILLIRVCMSLFFILLIYLTKKHKRFFLEHYQYIVSFAGLFIGVGILGMILLSESGGIIYTTYFAGLMLVIIAFFSWFYVNTAVTLSISLFFVLGYITVYVIKTDSPQLSDTLLLNNLIFLLASITFGLIADVFRKHYMFKNFITQKTLYGFLLPNADKVILPIDQQLFVNQSTFQQSINNCIFDAKTTNLRLIISTVSFDHLTNINTSQTEKAIVNALYQQSNAQLKAYRSNNVIWCLCFTKDSNDAFEQTLNTNIKTHLQQYKNNIHVKTSILELSKENEFEDQKILSLSALSDVELNNRPSNVVLVKS